MKAFSKWTPGELIAAAALLFSVLGTFAGGVWWCSAIYFEVRAIRTTMHDAIEDVQANRATLNDHERRITRLEP